MPERRSASGQGGPAWWRRRAGEAPTGDDLWQLERQIAVLRRDGSDLRRVLASLGEGVVAIGPSGVVLHANRAAVDLLGLDADACVGSHLYVAIPHPDLCDAIEAVLRHAVSPDASAGARDRELVVDRGGVPATLVAQVTPLRGMRGERQPEGAVAVIRDITELRRLERARQDFFANVSHELTTPVTAISGSIETVLHDPGMDPDVRVRFLTSAVAHADRLRALVTDLLALARLERDPHVLERAPTDLVELVHTTVAHQAHAAADRAATVRVELDGTRASMPQVEIDAEAVRQAVSNLLDNAIAHSNEGDEVIVRVARRDDEVEVAVIDSGTGIPEAALSRVFERFYRVDVARSRARGGTGIGLSIVKHVATAHGGSVSVESQEGAGSTFRLRLPVSPRAGTGTPSG